MKAILVALAQLWLAGAAACGSTHAQRQPDETALPPTLPDIEIAMFGGRANATGARLGDLQHIIYEFALERGTLPETIEEAIASEVRRSSHLGVDFMHLHRDLWGREVRYTHRAKMFEVRSAGEDAEFGTPDDIVVVGQQGRKKPCVARVGIAKFDSPTPPRPVRVNSTDQRNGG